LAANFLFLFVVFLIFLSNYLRGTTLLWPLLVVAVFAICQLLRFRQIRVRNDFLGQLKSHRRELRRGSTVCVDDMLIRYETPVTSYVVSVGLLFLSIDIPSSFRLVQGENPLEALGFSCATLVAGWWSITGPLHTIRALLINLRGGDKISVAALIDPTYLRAIQQADAESFT
jgi:hypothetical protein